METVQRGIAARSMAKIPAYADGGVVQPFTVRGILNRAKGLLESDPPETMTQKFARQDAERAAKSPPSVAPAAPAPEQKPDVIDTIKARNKLMQGLKDGGTVRAGIIRGPGTGTSDSIKGKMPVGSFVMPKDSTDVMVSNGETNFTPEMVQQIGAAALMATKGLTHTPVAKQVPNDGAQHFYSGGEVKDKAVFGFYPQLGGNRLTTHDTENKLKAGYTGAEAAPAVVAGTNIQGGGSGLRLNAEQDPRLQAAPQAAPSVTPSIAPGASPTGGITPPTTPAQPTSPAVAALVAPSAPNDQVTRVGNSYTGAPNISGDISINGRGVSQQSYPAAQALATPTAPAIEQGGVNYGDGSGRRIQGYQERLDYKNAQTGASSMFDTKSRRDATDLLKNMNAQNLAQPGIDSTQAIAKMQGDNNLATSKLSADTQRVGYGIQSQNNLATQQNAAARLGIERTTAGLQNQQTTQQIGAAKQMQDLQTRLLTAKPDERAAIEDNLRALQGKYEKPVADRYTVVPGGSDEMGNKQASRVLNNQTGQFVDQPQAKPSFEAGKVYTDAKGNRATWNGTAFVPAK